MRDEGADEIAIELLYWGAGLSGKTTNLLQLHAWTPPERRAEVSSEALDRTRVLSFCAWPSSLVARFGKPVRLVLRTVPGAVYASAASEALLARAHGVVFVVDSQRDRLAQAIEQRRALDARAGLPLVLQYNKRDLESAMPCEELDRALGRGDAPRLEAVATQGRGVLETLKACVHEVATRGASIG